MAISFRGNFEAGHFTTKGWPEKGIAGRAIESDVETIELTAERLRAGLKGDYHAKAKGFLEVLEQVINKVSLQVSATESLST